jgi:hypothetical protein
VTKHLKVLQRAGLISQARKKLGGRLSPALGAEPGLNAMERVLDL